jgi:putative flippase GtrA
MRAFVRFSIVGAAAFWLGAVIIARLEAAGVSPLVAQVPALAACVAFTWWCNRRWSFGVGEAPTWREFGRYVVSSAVGLAVNAAAFSALSLSGLPSTIAFALSTVAAMMVNFASYRTVVFRR